MNRKMDIIALSRRMSRSFLLHRRSLIVPVNKRLGLNLLSLLVSIEREMPCTWEGKKSSTDENALAKCKLVE